MHDPLPVDSFLERIEEALTRSRALVLIADPGAGKSTRVPPRLAAHGRTILLQPRRVAARAIAQRIGAEQQWSIGREVGWHVRGDRRESRDTRLLVATEGILTARLQRDPLASEFTTIILDEFHERSIHSDLALSLAREAWSARDDLRIVVMSATLDPGPVLRYLPDAELITVPGRAFAVDISHASDLQVHQALQRFHPAASGHTLVFFPGKAEIDRAFDEITADSSFLRIHRLHGSMTPAEQLAAIAPSQERKVILATNVAETSVTIEGVDLVIDTGLHKVMRFDPERGIDRLVLERIPLDAATQRSGRAGRTRRGTAVRLWDPRLILDPHREPEIHRVDLAPSALAIFAWGGDPRTFDWFESPNPNRIALAVSLLERLRFVEAGRITESGVFANTVPAHPRIARFLQVAGGGRRAASIAAAVGEGVRASLARGASDSDLFALGDDAELIPAVRNAARDLQRASPGDAVASDQALMQAALAAWPDRVARRRREGEDRYVLATGVGAVLARQSSVRNAEWIVAIEIGSSAHEGEPLIRVASAIDPAWLEPTATRRVIEPSASGPLAFDETMYDSIVLRRRRVPVDADILAEWRAREVMTSDDPDLVQLRRRLAFAGIELDLESLAGQIGSASASRLNVALPYPVRKTLDRNAPLRMEVPSGRTHRLLYREDGGVELEVKLQELFGMLDTPKIGPHQTPVTIVMLSPAGRPVQTTSDLRSFWEKTYFEVRKDLRGRYPKHPWPEDPLSATPTHRTTRKRDG